MTKNRIERNPITGERVLMTPNRLARPNALLDHDNSGECPFCPGNEDQTPPEIVRITRGDDWILRVVPNKYPAASDDSGILGRHEVIIESPRHEDELRYMDRSHVRMILDVWLDRYGAAAASKGVAWVALFRNRGPNAGESIRHPHSQLLAVPYVPERVALHTGSRISCVLCQVLADRATISIASGDHFELLSAPAARFPHQCWIAPRAHVASPVSMDDAAREELAGMLCALESALVDELGEISINWTFITPPLGTTQFHWYLEVSPRITGIAGFELATGSFVNLVPPEISAELLRKRLRR